MKALSLWQPWATLVAIGKKKIETRHWSTSYRGPLVIHAAKRFKIQERILAESGWFHYWLKEAGYRHSQTSLPFGCFVAIVDLVDIVPTEEIPNTDDFFMERVFGNFSPGRFAWKLENLRRIEPLPGIGQQGMWNLDSDIVDLLRARIIH